MIIERVTDWDATYTMYKATYKVWHAYGCEPVQALRNLLGVLDGVFYGR